MRLPVPIFVQSILEAVHSWDLHHVLRQLVPEISYSVAVEMLSKMAVAIVMTLQPVKHR